MDLAYCWSNDIFNKMGVLDPPKITLSILVVVKMNLFQTTYGDNYKFYCCKVQFPLK